MKEKSKKGKKILVISLSILLTICLGLTIAYQLSLYHPNKEILSDLSEEGIALYEKQENIHIQYDRSGIKIIPDNPKAGIIFYPGAMVEMESYFPLGAELARKGYAFIIVDMPFNFALLGTNSADKIMKDSKNLTDSWYLAGHSLGGVAAGMYLYENSDDYEGLILLASYVTKDFSDINGNLKMLSIYGSEDKVLSIEAYEEHKGYLINLEEHVINGGCHAYFGDYGAQKGDGTPSITREKQIDITANYIDGFISGEN